MRLAVVCTDTGVRVPDAKGASLHLVAIVSALARCGHEVMLCGVAGHGNPPSGVRSLLFPHPGRAEGLRRELRKLAFVGRVARLARQPLLEFGPEIVYERLSLFGTAGQRLAAAVSAPHVVEVNALLAEEEARWRGLRLTMLARHRELVVLRRASLRVAVSEEVAARVEGLAPGPPTAVLPNGVDAEAFAHLPARNAARTALGLPLDRPIVGFAGALRPWHGLDVAIRALPLVPGAMLAVAGDGPVRLELQGLASRLGVVDRVHWLGQRSHEEVVRFLAGLDVALLPYPDLPDFGFSPLKLYEYLAAGVPVVASDLGQVRLALEGGRWGRLVPAGDELALAEAVRSVLASMEDSRRVAQGARRFALKSHSWERRAERLTELLTAVRDAHALAR